MSGKSVGVRAEIKIELIGGDCDDQMFRTLQMMPGQNPMGLLTELIRVRIGDFHFNVRCSGYASGGANQHDLRTCLTFTAVEE